jgi:hypothetical protein
MEGSNGQQVQSAQPRTPRKKDALPLLAYIMVEILLVASVTTLWLASPNYIVWSPHRGDFLEYTVNETGGHIQPDVIVFQQYVRKDTVKAVNGASVVWNITRTDNGHSDYDEIALPLNERILPNIDLSHPPDDFTLQKVGTESIITKWGSLSTDHYHLAEWAQEGGPWFLSGDVWIRHGVALKAFWVTQAGFTYTIYLSDTNVPGTTS